MEGLELNFGAGDGEEGVGAGGGGKGEQGGDDLVNRVVADDATTVQAGDGAATGVEEAEVVEISVAVATVERGLRVEFFCRMAMAGAMPSISSTAGFSMRSRNCLAYADSDST